MTSVSRTVERKFVREGNITIRAVSLLAIISPVRDPFVILTVLENNGCDLIKGANAIVAREQVQSGYHWGHSELTSLRSGKNTLCI